MVFKNEKEYGNYRTIKRVVARMTNTHCITNTVNSVI